MRYALRLASVLALAIVGSSFLAGHAAAQQTDQKASNVSAKISADDPLKPAANLTKPGSIAQFTFDSIAGQRIYIDVPSSELPSQCGILNLKAPDGNVVASGCIINHKGGFHDEGFVLPETGRYTLVLDPSEKATGKTTVRLRNR